MSTALNVPNCDVTMIARIVEPKKGDLSIAAARAFLKFTFPQSDVDRMEILAQKARDGTLSAEEEEEITDYERVGYLLGALQSKARLTLKRHVNGRQ